MLSRFLGGLAAVIMSSVTLPSTAQQAAPPAATLFQNVRVFNGTDKLSPPTNVLVVGKKITAIGASAASPGATVIEGGGRTLMPGLIDAHTHIMFASIPQLAI